MAAGRRLYRGQTVNEEIISTLDQFAAPYGRDIKLEAVVHESGLHMLRIHIKEGNRFTVMDLDQETAVRWSTVMRAWTDRADQGSQ